MTTKKCCTRITVFQKSLSITAQQMKVHKQKNFFIEFDLFSLLLFLFRMFELHRLWYLE